MSFAPAISPEQHLPTLLAERLLGLAVGESISYAELSAVAARIGHESIDGGSWQMQRAIEICLRRFKVKFRNDRGHGYTRITDAEIVNECGADRLKRIRRSVRNGIREQHAISNFSAMSHRDQMRSSALTSMLGTVEHLSRPRQVARIEERIGNQDQPLILPVAQVVRMFTKGG